MIASAGLESGKIYIWATNNPQRWSALAPDFREIEENVEYIEREDEFDYQDREVITKRRLDREDEEVDLLTIEPTRVDDENAGWTMPVLLDIEESSSDDGKQVFEDNVEDGNLADNVNADRCQSCWTPQQI